MSLQTATMAAQARGGQARAGWIEACPNADDFTPTLTGWRVGLAGAIVAAVLALLAVPVAVVLDPAVAGQALRWLGHLALVMPVMTAVRALVLVVAVVVISRPDARP
ncbi:MAG TPA: hypothetical protein VGV88_11890 [Candidatus Dormibacteraeota bacterium]|nr:hypothetical protein [Candidatus Dormibacteraeota bacterium]